MSPKHLTQSYYPIPSSVVIVALKSAPKHFRCMSCEIAPIQHYFTQQETMALRIYILVAENRSDIRLLCSGDS